MNSKHIIDLTVRLSQALDQNYDVVDMDAVLSVISTLEGTTITKEQLEATRLAKYINQLRRRTKNDHLAKRAKSLLKKWREMVGMQQQAIINEPTSLPTTTNANVNDSNLLLQHQQHYHHRSQPTSPLVGDGIHLGYENHSNLKQHSHSDFLRSTMSNPASTTNSSLTRSANTNVHISNKRYQEFYSGNLGDTKGNATDVNRGVGGKIQPTSFANLLTNFEIGKKPNVCNATAGQLTASQRFVGRKSNTKPQDGTVLKPTEFFIIDQSSNSNSEMSCSTTTTMPSQRLAANVFGANVAPIVIDIQDSNSDSDLIDTTKTVPVKTTPLSLKVDAASLSGIQCGGVSVQLPLKQKRLKKEKKRRDRENPMVVIDDNSSNQQLSNTEERKLISIIDEKSRSRNPISNISEILSLSNSSISSIFPADGGISTVVDENKRPEFLTSARDKSISLTTSDLTFAGKFKQHSTASSSITVAENSLNSSNRNDAIIKNLPKLISTSPNNPQTQQVEPKKFIPFRGSVCNSTDSTSNSRTSQFDVVEVHNLDNNRTKLVEALISSNKMSIPQKSFADSLHAAPTTSSGLASVPIQAVILDSNTVSTMSDKKIPKKRGRKKGSKGVDAVIGKDTSLSSQILITSLGSSGKKVKTTKELYAEMQNRKLGITTATSSPSYTNWATQQQLTSRPESSCSEPSLQSPHTLDACSTNATMSTVATRSTPDKYLVNTAADRPDSESDTATSEPSRDSGTAPKMRKRNVGIDANSNLHTPATATDSIESKKLMLTTDAIDKQLRDLLKQFPKVPNIKEMEVQCTNETLPCTCEILEIIPEALDKKPADEQSELNVESHKASESKNSKSPVLGETFNNDDNNKKVQNQSKEVVIDVKPLSTIQKPQKSIFDLDFDEDDDPLHSYIAEAIKQDTSNTESKQDKTKSPINPNCKPEDLLSLSDIKQQPQENTQVEDISIIEFNQTPALLSIYQVKEDPNCVAKQRFELQTQKITKFHIDALHNCYIPNVNGNWDNADISNGTFLNNESDDLINLDGSHVVPKYGSLINDRIQKDLSHVNFTKNYVPSKASDQMEMLNNIPFLGVSRLRRTHKKQKQIANIVELQGTETENKFDCSLIKLTEKDSECDNSANMTFLKINNNNNINNKDIVLNDIKIEILEPDSYDIAPNNLTDCSVTNLNKGQSLLVIADTYNYVNNTSTSQTNNENGRCLNTEVHKQAETDFRAKKGIPSIVLVEPNLIGETTCAPIKIEEPTQMLSKLSDDHTSRRSSSCSNSSLKQTQQSINLKLRRRRLLQQQKQQNKPSNSYNSKRRHKQSADIIKHRKPCTIKRIKIAINGDVATQRQISSCSNNSSDDYDDNTLESSDKTEMDNDDDEEDVLSVNSSVSDYTKMETDEDIGEANEMAEKRLANNMLQIIQNDNESVDFEDDEDDDEEDDEEEEDDYSGDFHEVVTRDISIPSTGNNHIVLTIKKTPSKTNSPSYSLSAMSPVISTTTGTVAAAEYKNNKVMNDSAGPAMSNIGFKMDPQNHAELIESAIQSETLDQLASSISVNHQVAADQSIGDNDLTLDKMLRGRTQLPIRKRCKRRTKADVKPFQYSYEHNNEKGTIAPTTSKKLHQQLFFPYELYVGSNCYTTKERILNISSCSSSCGEESEFEHISSACTTFDDDNKRFRTVSTSSNISTNASSISCASNNNCTILNEMNDQNFELQQSSKKSVCENLKAHDSNDTNVELALENNELLLSFNNIYSTMVKEKVKANSGTVASFKDTEAAVAMTTTDGVYYDAQQSYELKKLPQNSEADEKEQQLRQHKLPNENCDDYNNFCNNNNNLNLIKNDSNRIGLINNDSCNNICKQEYGNSEVEFVVIGNESEITTTITTKSKVDPDCNYSTKTIEQIKEQTQEAKITPLKEYRTGLRAVDEDVVDEDGNNCARMQQFKEWHQTLQLRSYNDELLTVLPYVVLE